MIKIKDLLPFRKFSLYIHFYTLSGFDVDLFGLSFFYFENRQVHVRLMNSNFILFKNHKIVDESKCNSKEFSNDGYFVNIFYLLF